jgi:hypothetical protein
MKSRKRMPSPAMVIAVIALVAGVAGSAIALPGRNSVDGNDLKRNVVKTKNIKRNAVKRGKIAPNAINSSRIAQNSVNGGDINEASLSTVPSAATVTSIVDFNERLTFGQDVQLVSNGAVQIRARCVQNGTIGGVAARDGVVVYAATTTAASFMNGLNDRFGDVNGNGLVDAESLDPADAPDDSRIASTSFANGAPDEQFVSNNIDQGFVVSAAGDYIGINSEGMLLGLRALGSDCAVIGQANVQG